MKTLVVISALVACCTAGHSWGYSAIDAGVWGNSLLSPRLYAAPAYASYAAPAYASYAAPAYASYAAPAVVATRTIAAAPVVAAAAAPVVDVAPTVVATRTVAAAPVVAPAPIVAAAPAVVAPAVTKTQYHSQDELGQASYGHAEPLQTHNAVQDAHGNKIGSFSYLNPHDGQVHRTDYIADALGYRVAANDLPIDTPEVALAKAAHLTAHAAARSKRSLVAVAETPASTTPLVAAPAPLWATRSAVLAAPAIYGAPAVYGAHAIAAPAVYSAPVAAPAVYSAPVAAPAVYSAPAVRAATLTTVVNNPGHAVSYRVD
ncbi:hypothetical protein GE061_010423 [Apolygus lucorum]|uniref:Cuticle protein 7 n=1 Tax=Apolygus lucorum TaxID=248454 RepID=A0A8S9Y362_APOLU|nr:hypothetical protein GE061_010423 [Apolygus lucorum]